MRCNMNPGCSNDDPWVIHPSYTGRDKGAIMIDQEIATFYSQGHAWKYIFQHLQPEDDRACTNYRVLRLSEYRGDERRVVVIYDNNEVDDHIVGVLGPFPGADYARWLDIAERRFPQTTGSLSYVAPILG